MDTPYRWTVDLDGGDFGGRSQSISGTIKGVGILLDFFKIYKIKALWFVSTEILGTGFTPGYDWLVKDIANAGHEIGSHGHFHVKWDTTTRKIQDKVQSQYAMRRFNGNLYPRYRAPWFQFQTEDPYSHKRNHVSVLKQTWFGGKIPQNPIFYIHPFDVVGGEKAPSLFTALLYSRPKEVLKRFEYLCSNYS